MSKTAGEKRKTDNTGNSKLLIVRQKSLVVAMFFLSAHLCSLLSCKRKLKLCQSQSGGGGLHWATTVPRLAPFLSWLF